MSAQAFHSIVHSRKITQMGSKGEQYFLHMTYHLDLIYICIPNITKISERVKELLSAQAFPFKVIQGRQLNGQQGGATILERDTLS